MAFLADGVHLCVVVLMDGLKPVERLTGHMGLRSQRMASEFAFTGGPPGGPAEAIALIVKGMGRLL